MNSELPRKQNQWKQWLAAFAASSAMFSGSLDIVWISRSEQDLPVRGVALNTNLVIIGLKTIFIIIGAILGALSANIFGRKTTLLVMLIFVIPRVVNIYFNEVGSFGKNTLLLDVASGITCTVVPLYISEIASTNNRGNLMVMQLSVVQSGVIALWIAVTIHPSYFFYEGNEILLSTLLTVSILLHAIILGIYPETPQYLNWKKRYQEAAHSLAFFRGMKHVKIKENASKLTLNRRFNNNGRVSSRKISEILKIEHHRSLAIIFSLIGIKWASGMRRNELILMNATREYRWTVNNNFPLLGLFPLTFIFCVFIMLTIGVFRRKLSLLLVILGSFISAIIGMTTLINYHWVLFGVSCTQYLGHLILLGVTLAYVGECFPMNVRATAIAVVISFEVLCRNLSFGIELLLFGEVWTVEFPALHFCLASGVYIGAFFLVFIFFPKTDRFSCIEIMVEDPTDQCISVDQETTPLENELQC